MVNRAHPRFAVAVELGLTVGAVEVHGRTENMSKGGLCAEVDRTVQLGDGVVARLALVFPGEELSEPLSIGGRVVWCTPINNGFQIGIQFTTAEGDLSKDLDLFLRFLAARPG